ncbi:MAG: ABC transporter permease [Bryobacteraceae bacterium]|nr:ABC transporter permease [Bryobacteraceae bacterium]
MRQVLGLYVAAVFAFLHLPLVVLAVFSLNESKFTVWQRFSLRWYVITFRDAQLAEATLNSLSIAIVSTVFATAIGTLCAYALWKKNSRVISSTLYLSLVTPEIVMGVSLLAFFQWLFRYFSVQLGMHTVILAHTMFCLAYVVVVVTARLRTMDITLEEAALDLGATEWQVFRRVTMPMILPAVGAAALLSFTISFDDYVITSMVAGVDSQTLPMVIYAMARRGANPEVNAISTLIAMGLGVFVILAERLQRR